MKPDGLRLPELLWLFAGLALAAAPHFPRLPWWLAGTAAMLLVWRMYLAWNRSRLPGRWVVIMVALTGLVGVYFTYRTLFGRDAGVALLVMLLALKLMEMKTPRDVYVTTFLAYFLALTNFFYSQTIPTASLMLVTVLAITASLVGFNAPGAGRLDHLKTAAMLLAQAGPVMLLLFLLFPRVTGPLWGLPQDAFAGVTGLGDTMSPGTISRLSQSDAIAFRAKFAGRPPPRSQLYWRGPVLWEFDGGTWRPGGIPRIRSSVQMVPLGSPVDYEITLEPHNRQWLFALDLPARIPANSRITSDYQLLSLPPVRARQRYEIRSFTQYRALAGAEIEDLRAARQFPPRSNPRAQNLAREWRRTTTEHEALARRAIDFLRAGKYEYTLQPPLLGEHSVDEFLFDTRQGFCEHFAASFVFLMRAAGVPARVVTGYQGGEVNPVDDYMILRQADAHAWAELWFEEQGWVRFDPTAAVSPIRVESGIAAAVPLSAGLPLLMRTDLNWLRTLRDNWEALGNRWNQWVLGYNPDRQREMMAWFGMRTPSWQALAMALFWSIACVLGLTALWLLSRYRPSDPTQKLWLAFCGKLDRAGLSRDPAEGPLDFSERAARRFPACADAVRVVANLYMDIRYGSLADRESLARLRALVRDFRP